MAKEQLVSNKYVSWVLYEKFRTEKHCLVKHFAFLKNVCYQYLNLMLWVTFCLFVFFFTSWLVDNQLSWNVLLFSCDPIGHPCLSDPGYSSRTVILESLSNNYGNGNEDGKKAIIFYWKKKHLCMCIALFVLSLRSQYDYNLKVPNFMFCRGRELKTTTLVFFSWTLIQSFRIQLQTNFLTCDKLNELE